MKDTNVIYNQGDTLSKVTIMFTVIDIRTIVYVQCEYTGLYN